MILQDTSYNLIIRNRACANCNCHAPTLQYVSWSMFCFTKITFKRKETTAHKHNFTVGSVLLNIEYNIIEMLSTKAVTLLNVGGNSHGL